MNRSILAFALCGLFAVSSAQSLRAQIDASNRAVSKALLRKDVTEFVRLVNRDVTRDFRYIEAGRSMSFYEMVVEMKRGLASMGKMTVASAKTLSLKEHGESATATTKHTMSGNVSGQDKKPHILTVSGVSTDIYRKVKGKWMMCEMDWKDDKMTLDGKPFNPTNLGSGN